MDWCTGRHALRIRLRLAASSPFRPKRCESELWSCCQCSVIAVVAATLYELRWLSVVVAVAHHPVQAGCNFGMRHTLSKRGTCHQHHQPSAVLVSPVAREHECPGC